MVILVFIKKTGHIKGSLLLKSLGSVNVFEKTSLMLNLFDTVKTVILRNNIAIFFFLYNLFL